MTPCGTVLGSTSRAKRSGQGTRSGTAASAKRREDQVDPLEPLKPSFAAPWPEEPNGIVGRTSATGRFFAAFDFGGGRACTRRAAACLVARSMTARTSGLGAEPRVTRRTATARACWHRCESGTRARGCAQL